MCIANLSDIAEKLIFGINLSKKLRMLALIINKAVITLDTQPNKKKGIF